MAIITFWNDAKKQTGQTMSIAAVATSMAIEHNYKILLISTQYNDNTLELCFGTQDKNKALVNKLVGNQTITVDNGIEGLFRIASSGKVTPDIISSYTHVVYRNRLEVLYGYKYIKDRTTREEYSRVKGLYKDIIQNANRYYDIVLVDLSKGLQDDMVKEILKISDLIVYNIEQKMDMIDQFVKIKNEVVESKNNIMLNIGRFDSDSKYSIKNISRYVGMKRDVTMIPYNTLYFEAAGEGNVADLFLKIRKVNQNDRNFVFIKQVQETVEKIIYKVQELQMKM